MKFYSHLIDRKIMGVNIGVEMTIGEYLKFAPKVIQKNEFQRRKVKSAGKTYDLLRKDLLNGCIMPPIILAVTDRYGRELDDLVQLAIQTGPAYDGWEAVDAIVERAMADNELLILDGLQRSLTIEGISANREGEASPAFFDQVIRVEIYVGLSKTGILYRMLTLNTGQTPMSFRHQLEILYYDYIDNSDLPNGIIVLKEVEEKRARGAGRYKYTDIIDMFYAFSTGTPMPYDRQALVGELREMDFLERYSYRADADDMRTLLLMYNDFITRVDVLSSGWAYQPEDDAETIARPFGASVSSIFARPQPMSGFGAECKRLVSNGSYARLEDIGGVLPGLRFSRDPTVAFDQLLTILNEIAQRAKKIGDAQRAYFQFAMRALLLPGSDTYLDLSMCWLKAQTDYEMMYA
ncbi:hypothetical protein [Gluconacetobacter takamatsuzukensis]|uniref:Uncharacterized protein n=1 Tax=Gluconacetobacter takamatsuzukensis TaxID=1286190 RepID=A0A7W4KBI1_9PROT|nr:hypothetical protein [Gluconacetobacter takamatsuzukensis]MBB2203886.1 hypothetical protein [Gluconacetobacter takamatsuzukensis]